MSYFSTIAMRAGSLASAAPVATGPAPTMSSQSPLAQADQRLNLPEFAAIVSGESSNVVPGHDDGFAEDGATAGTSLAAPEASMVAVPLYARVDAPPSLAEPSVPGPDGRSSPERRPAAPSADPDRGPGITPRSGPGSALVPPDPAVATTDGETVLHGSPSRAIEPVPAPAAPSAASVPTPSPLSPEFRAMQEAFAQVDAWMRSPTVPALTGASDTRGQPRESEPNPVAPNRATGEERPVPPPLVPGERRSLGSSAGAGGPAEANQGDRSAPGPRLSIGRIDVRVVPEPAHAKAPIARTARASAAASRPAFRSPQAFGWRQR